MGLWRAWRLPGNTAVTRLATGVSVLIERLWAASSVRICVSIEYETDCGGVPAGC